LQSGGPEVSAAVAERELAANLARVDAANEEHRALRLARQEVERGLEERIVNRVQIDDLGRKLAATLKCLPANMREALEAEWAGEE
jgi:hypothetical protein